MKRVGMKPGEGAPITRRSQVVRLLGMALRSPKSSQLPQYLQKVGRVASAPGMLFQHTIEMDPKLSSSHGGSFSAHSFKTRRKPQLCVHAAPSSLLGELAVNFRGEIWLWRLGLKHGEDFQHIAAKINVFPIEKSVRKAKMFSSIPLSFRLHQWKEWCLLQNFKWAVF